MPLYKGIGSRIEYGNPRAISLLSSAGKLYGFYGERLNIFCQSLRTIVLHILIIRLDY